MDLHLSDAQGEPELLRDILTGTRRAAGRQNDAELCDRIDRILRKLDYADAGEDDL